MPMPNSIIKRVNRHAQRDKTLGRLVFADRNNRPIDYENEELNETPERIVEPEPSPFPDIPAEIPGVDLEEHLDTTTPAVAEPNPDAVIEAEAIAAAANARLNPESIPATGTNDDPVHANVIEPDDDVSTVYGDDDNDVISIQGDIPINDPETVVIEDDQDQGAEPFEEGAALQEQGAASDDESMAEELEEVQPRRSRRVRKERDFYGEWMNVAFENKPTESTIDEYMHSMINGDKADEIDSYLPAVFEFIMGQYAERSAMETVRGGYKDAVKHLVVNHLMAQYSLKAGLKKFGEAGEKAVTKELTQFHDMSVFRPVDASTLSGDNKRAALASILFLKEKRDGRIKARACADGRKQRETMSQEEAASPTVSIESVFVTATIEAKENRDVATIDLPGAFLHADCPDFVLMKFQGRLAELMVMASPQTYRKYVTTGSKGEPVLFVKLQKALYGMLKSALLFYKKLVTDLVAQGFEINPYDPCVVNKMINGHQMTICWHVDDLKISHKDHREVTKIEEWLKGIYGDITVCRGKKHTYLGMQLDYSSPGECKVGMVPYSEEVINDFPEEITGTAATPAADHLFKVRDPSEARPLPEEQAVAFHRSVAQLLFLSGRALRDLQTTVAFLTTRVKSPDEDDWGKIKRALRYLKGTKHLVLTLSADSLGIIRWWVDASYATHEDCRGHTGAIMSMGKGANVSFSRKQKLNVRSSTEAELIGVYDALPSILHMLYFIVAQGYDVGKNIIYQDNKSSITLEQNGKASSSKRTKHIKVRYFFIKDVIERGEAEVQHCPTKQMWADVLTKPLQGQAFYDMPSKLMGCPAYLPEEQDANEAPRCDGGDTRIAGVCHRDTPAVENNDSTVSKGAAVLLDTTNKIRTAKGKRSAASLRGCVGKNALSREATSTYPTRGANARRGVFETPRSTIVMAMMAS